MIRRSEQINEIAKALAVAQSVIRAAAKDSVNPHFKNRYADLAAVVEAYRDPFAINGLALTQHPSADGAKVTVTSCLLHTSGQWMESDLTLTAQQNSPQSVGSAITYARRYAAMGIAGIAPDDDDGNEATRPRQTAALHPVGKPLDLYVAKPDQKKELTRLAKNRGVEARETLIAISKACEGIEMELLDAAVYEWIGENRP